MKDQKEKEPEETEVEVLASPKFFQQVTAAEVDVQVATAKKYPRSLDKFRKTAEGLATLNEETAESCFYVLPRSNKNIEGPSARLAEILYYAWGNMRADARIVEEDDRFVTARGVAWDLEANNVIGYEVRRRVTDHRGRKYNDDMIGMTANAACSIALRNAIFKVVPKPAWDPIYRAAKRVAIGDSTTLETRRDQALSHFAKSGVKAEQVFKKLGVKSTEEITLEHLGVLKGLATAIREGDTSIDQAFAEERHVEPPKPKEQQSSQSEDTSQTQENADELLRPAQSNIIHQNDNKKITDLREFIEKSDANTFFKRPTLEVVSEIQSIGDKKIVEELMRAFTEKNREMQMKRNRR